MEVVTQEKDELRRMVAELVEERDALAAKLAELERQEPVVKYSGKRLTPEGTKEMWGYLLSEVEPRENQELYARPVPAEPVNAKLLRALKELIRDADCSDYGEEGINYPVPSTHLRGASCPICEARDAIADAESQAGPVRLTEAEIGVIDRQSREGIKSLMSTWPVPLARAIEDAVLERNGLKPSTCGD